MHHLCLQGIVVRLLLAQSLEQVDHMLIVLPGDLNIDDASHNPQHTYSNNPVFVSDLCICFICYYQEQQSPTAATTQTQTKGLYVYVHNVIHIHIYMYAHMRMHMYM